MSFINVSNVCKTFGEKKVLDDISFSAENETVAVTGVSGSGKTTLLRIVAGLETADMGEVQKEGAIAFAFSEPRLFESISALENVACIIDAPKIAREQKAAEILSSLGISGDAMRLRPSELSAGMAQRVSLARAVASDREIYLLDEPTSNLDEETKKAVVAFLREFRRGKTALVVTHDASVAEALAQKTLILEKK